MKKYKLIKEYPGSPKLGTKLTPKVDKENTDTNNFYWEGSWFNPNDFHEFWEEIIEKNYKILEIKGKYGSISSYIEEYDSYLKNKFIYKIKRLSDGEIFTIGDRVNNSTFGGNGIIKSIRDISNDFIMFRVIFDKSYIDSDDSECFLKNLQKIKQPLFTTEDGVDIFEGDTVYYIETEEEPELCFIVNKYTVLKHSGRFTSDNLLHSFSTKEKAEEYIIMNKPCLSINEICDILDYEREDDFLLKEDLKREVKQKLNK